MEPGQTGPRTYRKSHLSAGHSCWPLVTLSTSLLFQQLVGHRQVNLPLGFVLPNFFVCSQVPLSPLCVDTFHSLSRLEFSMFRRPDRPLSASFNASNVTIAWAINALKSFSSRCCLREWSDRRRYWRETRRTAGKTCLISIFTFSYVSHFSPYRRGRDWYDTNKSSTLKLASVSAILMWSSACTMLFNFFIVSSWRDSSAFWERWSRKVGSVKPAYVSKSGRSPRSFLASNHSSTTQNWRQAGVVGSVVVTLGPMSCLSHSVTFPQWLPKRTHDRKGARIKMWRH